VKRRWQVSVEKWERMLQVFDQKKRVKGGYSFIQDGRLRRKVAACKFTRSKCGKLGFKFFQ